MKAVVHEGSRYVVCLNPEEAEHDRRAREEMVENAGYRRYLKVEGSAAGIDQGWT